MQANTMRGFYHLHWLAGYLVNGPDCPHLELVQHHVSETLIIYNTEINIGMEFLTGDSGVHGLISKVVVARCE